MRKTRPDEALPWGPWESPVIPTVPARRLHRSPVPAREWWAEDPPETLPPEPEGESARALEYAYLLGNPGFGLSNVANLRVFVRRRLLPEWGLVYEVWREERPTSATPGVYPCTLDTLVRPEADGVWVTAAIRDPDAEIPGHFVAPDSARAARPAGNGRLVLVAEDVP